MELPSFRESSKWGKAHDVLQAVHLEKSFSSLHTVMMAEIDYGMVEFVKELGAHLPPGQRTASCFSLLQIIFLSHSPARSLPVIVKRNLRSALCRQRILRNSCVVQVEKRGLPEGALHLLLYKSRL